MNNISDEIKSEDEIIKRKTFKNTEEIQAFISYLKDDFMKRKKILKKFKKSNQ